jgi:hypothetical protein
VLTPRGGSKIRTSLAPTSAAMAEETAQDALLERSSSSFRRGIVHSATRLQARFRGNRARLVGRAASGVAHKAGGAARTAAALPGAAAGIALEKAHEASSFVTSSANEQQAHLGDAKRSRLLLKPIDKLKEEALAKTIHTTLDKVGELIRDALKEEEIEPEWMRKLATEVRETTWRELTEMIEAAVLLGPRRGSNLTTPGPSSSLTSPGRPIMVWQARTRRPSPSPSSAIATSGRRGSCRSSRSRGGPLYKPSCCTRSSRPTNRRSICSTTRRA